MACIFQRTGKQYSNQIKIKTMKKSVIAVIALITLSLGACKKEYTCECEKTRTSGGTTLITEDGKYEFKDTRTRAESRCNEQEETGSDILGEYVRNCEIK
jgi:hypothetical protein